eukprot:COSAG06_NODE_1760_length_8452_cov_6.300012_7_plen_85_part_00
MVSYLTVAISAVSRGLQSRRLSPPPPSPVRPTALASGVLQLRGTRAESRDWCSVCRTTMRITIFCPCERGSSPIAVGGRCIQEL